LPTQSVTCICEIVKKNYNSTSILITAELEIHTELLTRPLAKNMVAATQCAL
jgi:hypothetical protein